MKKRLLILPLLALALAGCGDNSNTNGGGSQSGDVTHGDGSSVNSPLSVSDAISKMDAAGNGVVVENKEFFVAGTFDSGTTVDSKYHEWYGSVTAGDKVLKVTAKLASGISVTETNGGLDGKAFVVQGYLELYEGDYKIGFLPASASPTGAKFTPTIVKLDTTGGGTSGGGGGGQEGGGSQGSLSGLTSFVKVDFSSTTRKDGSGDHGRLTDSEIKTFVTGNTTVSGKVTNATGENVYQGYVPQAGDTSAYASGLDGCLRMGGSKKTGTLVLTVSEAAKGVRISAHGWETKGATSDTLAVNGSSALTTTISYANYEFTFSAGTTITITSTNRMLIQSIELFK